MPAPGWLLLQRQGAAHPRLGQAEDARQAGAEPLNGNGFYRFRIGDFQATVISDGLCGRFRSGDLRYERL